MAVTKAATMAIAESMMAAGHVAGDAAETSAIRWQPLGEGRQAPAGSIRNPELAALLAGYKEDVARRYQSLPPDRISGSLFTVRFRVASKIISVTAGMRSALRRPRLGAGYTPCPPAIPRCRFPSRLSSHAAPTIP